MNTTTATQEAIWSFLDIHDDAETIEVDDYVWFRDNLTGETGYGTVIKFAATPYDLHEHPATVRVYIETESGGTAYARVEHVELFIPFEANEFANEVESISDEPTNEVSDAYMQALRQCLAIREQVASRHAEARHCLWSMRRVSACDSLVQVGATA